MGTSGSLYFDDFEARRYAYIGPMEDSGIPDPEPPIPDGWLGASYSYDGGAPHAVTSVARQQYLGDENPIVDTYTYDGNGNMTCREENNVVWKHEYNEENRISAVSMMDGTDCASQGDPTDTWTYTYDGDGTRVLEEYYVGITLTMTKYYFAGGAYEIQDDGSTQTTLKYYSIAGMVVAMDNGSDLVYFASDHLSSTSIVMNTSGGLESQNRYLPFGQVRDNISDSPIDETDFGYTGQRNLADIGLMDYNARFYSPKLMRFIQPDMIIWNPNNPQNFNRYSYVNNSPIIFIDPLGLYPACGTRENPHCSQPKPSPNPAPPNIPGLPGNGDGDGNGNNGGSQTGDFELDLDELLHFYWFHWIDFYHAGKDWADALDMIYLYNDYKESPGWWNDDGDFTLLDFVALSIYFEHYSASGLGATHWDWVTSTATNWLLYEGAFDRETQTYRSSQNDLIIAVFNMVGQMASMKFRTPPYNIYTDKKKGTTSWGLAMEVAIEALTVYGTTDFWRPGPNDAITWKNTSMPHPGGCIYKKNKVCFQTKCQRDPATCP